MEIRAAQLKVGQRFRIRGGEREYTVKEILPDGRVFGLSEEKRWDTVMVKPGEAVEI